MKFVILLKSPEKSPGSEERLTQLSPGDIASLNLAMELASDTGATVTALSVSPSREDAALQAALRGGAERAIRIWDRQLLSRNINNLAAVLAATVEHVGFDLVFAGNRSSDWGSGATGPAVAHLLKIPHLTSISAIESSKDKFIVEHQRGETLFTLELKAPALLTVQPGSTSTYLERDEIPEIETLSLEDLDIKLAPATARRLHPDVQPIVETSYTPLEKITELLQLLKP